MNFKIISFDMFQTLVDVNARKYAVWEEILKERYTRGKAEELWQDTLKKLHAYVEEEGIYKGHFKPMYHKFSTCYE